MTKEISLVEACLIYSIKNRVDRKTTYKELGEILNDNKISSSTSTNLNNLFKENQLTKELFKFFYVIFKDLNLEFDKDNKIIFISSNNKNYIEKIEKFLNEIKISSSINKYFYDNNSSPLKKIVNEIIENNFGYISEDEDSLNRELLEIDKATPIYKFINGEFFYHTFKRFSIFDFFKLNERNILVKLDLESIKINIYKNLEYLSIYNYLTKENIDSLVENILNKYLKKEKVKNGL